MRSLLARYDGLQEAWWAHDAWICHVVANANRGPDSPVLQPAQLNPLLMDDFAGGGGIDLDPITIRAVAEGLRRKRGHTIGN